MEKLFEFIRQVQSDKRFTTFDEAAVKQGIVLKILSLLDWDPFNIDEVHPEYSIGNGKVDYALKNGASVRALLMVKKEGKRVNDLENELFECSSKQEVKLAVLTNGISWRLFSPLVDGNHEEKKFHTIDLNKQKVEGIAKSFSVFLSKTSVISGKALKAAENIYRIRQREALLHQHLPAAWQKIMGEPEKWLGETLSKATKGLCGYSPDREIVEKFIKSKIDVWGELSEWSNQKRSQTKKGDETAPVTYSAKAVKSFLFGKKAYKVDSWKDLLVKLCGLVYAKHPDDFEMVLTLANQDKEYFSEIQYKFLSCEKIPGTSMYVDTDLSPDEIVRICQEMLPLFGYTKNDFSIETK